MAAELGPALKALLAQTDHKERLAADPVRFAHRYTETEDIEIAALFSSQLAFGRVASFAKPLERLLDHADHHGGPAAWLRNFEPGTPAVLGTLNYRWIRPADFVAFTTGLRDLTRSATLSEAFAGQSAADALTAGVQAIGSRIPGPRTRGVGAFLSSPARGSACKRWCMFLRWMVRPKDGIDLGLWTHLDPSQLVIPLDTHVHRIARLTGLTERRTANWKTAVQITDRLAAIDPADPVRFDFALAHLGISGRCRATYDEQICPDCALRAHCHVGTPARHAHRRAART